MTRRKEKKPYSPYEFTIKDNGQLSTIFWKFLFFPDIGVKFIFYICAGHKEYLSNNFVFYWALTAFAIISCIYFPVIYVLTWKKANIYEGFRNWSVLAKLYIILSASISNSAFMVLGGGRFFI